jgi:CRP-like cAMP-binding protein
MADDVAADNLQKILEQQSIKLSRPASTVLFRRGESAAVMFVVLNGKGSLDLGFDSELARYCVPGAVVGLPSALTRHNHSMTATVKEDAELGFWSPEALDSLLRERPELCRPLLAILGERIAEDHDVESALLNYKRPPECASMSCPVPGRVEEKRNESFNRTSIRDIRGRTQFRGTAGRDRGADETRN